MEPLTILIVLALLLIGYDHIMLRRKFRSQGLALKALRGYCQDFTKSHSEAANVFGEQFEEALTSQNERIVSLYKKTLGLEDNAISVQAVRDSITDFQKDVKMLKEVVAVLNTKKPHVKKKVAKKKVAKKKVTKKKVAKKKVSKK